MKRNTVKKAIINKTSTPNFYDVLSSDNFTHYPLMLTAPGACLCGCPAGEAHRGCYHRSQALNELEYIPVVDDSISDEAWKRIELAAEWEATLDSVRDLLSDGPRAA